jgi:hypothetical protein
VAGARETGSYLPRRRLLDRDRPRLAFFGHHKCASTWVRRVLDEIAWGAGLKHRYFHRPEQFEANLPRFVDQHDIDVVSFVNADVDYAMPLGSFRGFHVVRDPRDLLVSAYFSHLHSHGTEEWPELEEHRARIGSVSTQEGLALELEFSGHVLDQLRRWDYELPNILELRQEDLTAAPYEGFLEIAEFLGLLDRGDAFARRRLAYALRSSWNGLVHRRAFAWLPSFKSRRIPAERVLGAVHEHRFSKLSGGREQGTEDLRSHYRKGVHGDWRNHFDAEFLERFKSEYGDVVLKLGYETDASWEANPASSSYNLS